MSKSGYENFSLSFIIMSFMRARNANITVLRGFAACSFVLQQILPPDNVFLRILFDIKHNDNTDYVWNKIMVYFTLDTYVKQCSKTDDLSGVILLFIGAEKKFAVLVDDFAQF